MKLNGTIKTKSASIENSTILATTPDLINVSKLVLRDGQFLDNTISEDTAVIGKQLAIDIFGTELAIGKTFSIKNHDFIVIGVLKNDNNPVNYNSIDFNNTAIINMSAGKKLNQNIAQIQQINFRSNNAETLSEQIDAVNKLIKSNHQNEADFSILTGGQISKPTSQLFYTIAGVTTAIAAISLVVGGIGIMNIMLVTVAERTHEIGIRKAIGASNIDISWQFLMESLAISIVGGIAGYLLGYVTAFTISSQMAFTPAFNLEIALTSLSVSILMGLIFGLYPALRAARKDPIEALNHRI
jgi:ABC-type antimicrobial peptide transport system permease subunit